MCVVEEALFKVYRSHMEIIPGITAVYFQINLIVIASLIKGGQKFYFR
jgi:hypothetical protein